MTTRIRTVASFIPAKARGVIYVALAAAIGLEQVWDLIPSPLEGKLLASLTVLGFVMAAANTPADTEET